MLKTKSDFEEANLICQSIMDNYDIFCDMHLWIDIAKNLIEKDHKPDGYNIGMNCGETAGQTVFHFHCHIIPRYKGDMENPRGGVRHCVSGKGNY